MKLSILSKEKYPWKTVFEIQEVGLKYTNLGKRLSDCPIKDYFKAKTAVLALVNESFWNISSKWRIENMYSKVSIKDPDLLNELAWIFPKSHF